jgi:hypothetical protein
MAEFIDVGRGLFVLLMFVGESRPVVQRETALLAFVLFRLGDRGDEFGSPPVRYDSLGWVALCIQFPMPRRVFVWEIQDRPVEKRITHAWFLILVHAKSRGAESISRQESLVSLPPTITHRESGCPLAFPSPLLKASLYFLKRGALALFPRHRRSSSPHYSGLNGPNFYAGWISCNLTETSRYLLPTYRAKVQHSSRPC